MWEIFHKLRMDYGTYPAVAAPLRWILISSKTSDAELIPRTEARLRWILLSSETSDRATFHDLRLDYGIYPAVAAPDDIRIRINPSSTLLGIRKKNMHSKSGKKTHSASGPCLDEEEPTASEPWWRALDVLLGRLWAALELLGLSSGFLVQYVDEGNPQEVGEFHDRGKASKASWYGEVAIPGMIPNNLRSEPHFSHGSVSHLQVSSNQQSVWSMKATRLSILAKR
ncbi:hypothetical protein Taro_041746 [Colocasia esculenta]|uniref:Uncharacterized protein n=1 Tax=Colocasia esculenta TaxID=4460 RepID=A0A843WQS8_COLES|nr:hypothetical protein [Colocasia esculenta]